jgi:hypothetical protein
VVDVTVEELAVGLEPTNLEVTNFALYQLSYASVSTDMDVEPPERFELPTTEVQARRSAS